MSFQPPFSFFYVFLQLTFFFRSGSIWLCLTLPPSVALSSPRRLSLFSSKFISPLFPLHIPEARDTPCITPALSLRGELGEKEKKKKKDLIVQLSL